MKQQVLYFIRWHVSLWLFSLATKISPTYKAEIDKIDGNTITLQSTTGLRPRDVILIKRTP